jgi:deferrochelatase/peroxidase EfeB
MSMAWHVGLAGRSGQGQIMPNPRRLAGSDALNRHTVHTANAIYACPPGANPGGYVGESLFRETITAAMP